MLLFMLKYKTDFLFEVLRSCAVKIIPVCSIVFIEIKHELCKSYILIARCRNLTVHFSGSFCVFFLTLYGFLIFCCYTGSPQKPRRPCVIWEGWELWGCRMTAVIKHQVCPCTDRAPCFNTVYRFKVCGSLCLFRGHWRVSFHPAASLVVQKPDLCQIGTFRPFLLYPLFPNAGRTKICCICSDLHFQNRTNNTI